MKRNKKAIAQEYDMQRISSQLKEEMPYKWKIQTVSDKKPKAMCVAYIDARDVMDRLDDVVGMGNWKDEYRRDGVDRLICKLSIKVNGEWVSKEDIGVESRSEEEKGEYSDAFKRAAVKWGIGRFLYSLKPKSIDTNKPGRGAYPLDSHGKRIWDLTEHFESKEVSPRRSQSNSNGMITEKQKILIKRQYSHMEKQISDEKLNKLTKEQASSLISKLLDKDD